MPRHTVILGGGIIGASTAYYLTLSGERVTLVEQVALAAAASGKSGGFLARDWHGQETAALGALSFDLHRELAEALDGENGWGYRKVTTYATRHAKSGTGKGKDRGLGRRHGVDWLDGAEAVLEHVELLGDESTTAQVDPKALTERLVAESQTRGLQVVIDECVAVRGGGGGGDEADGQADKILELKSGQVLRCSDLVIAAGPWSGRLISRLFPHASAKSLAPISGQKAHSIVLGTARPASAHILFTSIDCASGKREAPEVYARPNGTVYICGGDDDTPLPENATLVEPDRSKTGHIYALAKSISPLLGDEKTVLEREQACYLPVSGQGHPLIGPLGKKKGLEGVWLSAGHSCWGVTLSLGSGRVLAEMMTSRKTSANVEALLPV